MSRQIARLQPTFLDPFIYEHRALRQAFDFQPNLNLARGTVLGQVTAAVNDVDTVTMTGTGGAWALAIQNNNGTYTITGSAYNISTAALQTAIQALPNVGSGNATVSGTAGTSYVITSAGALAGYPIGVVTVDPTNGGVTPLTGGTATVAHTTSYATSGAVKAYASGNSDGSQVPVGILIADIQTDALGNLVIGGGGAAATAVPNGGLSLGNTNTGNTYVSGFFRQNDLVGWDANALSVMKARVAWVLADGSNCIMIPGP